MKISKFLNISVCTLCLGTSLLGMSAMAMENDKDVCKPVEKDQASSSNDDKIKKIIEKDNIFNQILSFERKECQ